MKITAIKQQVKRADRFSIFVDEVYAFSLSERELISSGIHKGQELTDQELIDFKETSKIDKVYELVLRLIARRPRSQRELRDYLRHKKQDEKAEEVIFSKLNRAGLIDDQDFAQRWVANRRLLKPVSRKRLVAELHQKGIAKDIIDKVLAADETDEKDVLKDLIERKRRQAKYQDDTKLMQYLARQGFSYDDIKSAMSNG